MRIGFAYNQLPDGTSDAHAVSDARTPIDMYVEWDEPETIAAVSDALGIFGEVLPLEAVEHFPSRLRDARVDLLFNMAEGLTGPNRESHVPAIAEFLGVPYVGSDPLALALALHKGRAKETWTQRGVPTAPFLVLESETDLSLLKQVRWFPAFLKPVWEGSSKGISEASFVSSAVEAMERAEYLLAMYDEPVLAEAYLPGDEFTIAVLGTAPLTECLPVIRYRFDELPDGSLPIMGYEAKWLWDQPEAPLGNVLECPARVSKRLERVLKKIALTAYDALGCRDWARIDLRLDGAANPFVLEVNPLPGLMPNPESHSCFPHAAAAVGMTYAELVQRAVHLAWKRITGQELLVETLAGAAH